MWKRTEARGGAAARDGTDGKVAVSDFGPLQATLVSTAHRTPEFTGRSGPEVLGLICVVLGRAVLEQDGRRADFGIGDVGLYDTSRPHSAELAPGVAAGRLLLLRFPRTMLPLSARDLRRLTAVRIAGTRGTGALCSQFLLHLARHLKELGPRDVARLSTLTLDVLTTTLSTALDAQERESPRTGQRALTTRIHTFVEDNLGDARLTPDTIASAHHISLRYLHKLFHAEGHTVAGWVRERRLERCRRDLADPLLIARPIHAIAARWGFTSAAHFSQVFRDAHGVSPSRFRQQCAHAEDLCAR